MIVDVDGIARATLSAALARAGYGVCTSNCPVRARRLAEVATPNIALVAVSAAEATLDLVRALKARFGRAIYIAAMTCELTPETRAAYVAAGADDVLAKPLALADLRRSVTAVTRTRATHVKQ